MDQRRTPLADALINNRERECVPFDVPGHKGNLASLKEYYGSKCISLDVNSREQLDYLCQPKSCILEAEELAAEAFGATYAWFMVAGTTSAVHAMVISACPPGSKILLPRNVHSSVINAVILSGAIPVYMQPQAHRKLGIPLGIGVHDTIQYIENNPDATAILVNNPTCYGICSSLKEIVDVAHKYGILVLVDEAHGTHFYFGDNLPANSMQCGADYAAVSMHKTGGSLTQSSLLLASKNINPEHTMEMINLCCTTSASYLLLSSLDLARKYMVMEGREGINQVLKMVDRARNEINDIDGLYAFADEISQKDDVFDFDRTKLAVYTSDLGISGIETYRILRDCYNIQVEFGDMNNIMAIGSIGDLPEYYKRLVMALKDIAKKHGNEGKRQSECGYIKPIVCMSPREAFFGKKRLVTIRDALGYVSCSSIMSYPPGVPIIAPGELVTDEVVDYILRAKQKGCKLSGLSNGESVYVTSL